MTLGTHRREKAVQLGVRVVLDVAPYFETKLCASFLQTENVVVVVVVVVVET